MNERKITVAMVEAYDRKLKEDEHAAATREKYLRSVRAFAVWLDGAAVTKEAVTEWKAHLAERRQAPSTVNTALAALNGLFRFLGWEDCRARFLKVQRRIFRAPERELTRAEYDRLLDGVTGKNRERDYCILTLFLNCGLRISELCALNLQDIQDDALRVLGKGNKVRIVYLNDACKSALDAYRAVRRPVAGRDKNRDGEKEKLGKSDLFLPRGCAIMTPSWTNGRAPIGFPAGAGKPTILNS